ncbi:MAG: arginine--tRNA ligase [Schleiferiaceae bacterium]
MTIESTLRSAVQKYLLDTYEFEPKSLEFQATRKEFKGQFTLVVFPMVKVMKKSPEMAGQEIGEYLVSQLEEVSGYNVVKGFLNLEISLEYWSKLFVNQIFTDNYGVVPEGDRKQSVMVEYSSPNTNKPLHLGHIRNNLLGFSMSQILEAAGNNVIKVQIINDRGIHICKSMLAWKLFGEGETPESSGLKGDKLVGKYYVAFDAAYKVEINQLVEEGMDAKEAEKKAPLMIQAQEMLRAWEDGDKEVVDLWKTMNGWVYDGFNQTYDSLGVSFDKNYYESDTYILGKQDVEKGLETGVFYKKEDGSVWIDLTAEGLDEKLVLRSDGTSVYMTQDIGTAIQRFKDFDISGLTYVVGNEQDYHFKVLFLILAKLGYEWADKLYHLSYGMVDLPSGKMKSREGTVVDADDLMDEMYLTAKSISEELGKQEGYSEEEKETLYHTIGMGALKYFMLKVDPRKRMMFNPAESIDFNGNTGPFIQYTHARIQSLERKGAEYLSVDTSGYTYSESECELIVSLSKFPEIIQQAAAQYSPAVIANYIYDLVKDYNGFYQNHSILNADSEVQIAARLKLSVAVRRTVNIGMGLLGIDSPERM